MQKSLIKRLVLAELYEYVVTLECDIVELNSASDRQRFSAVIDELSTEFARRSSGADDS